MNALHSARACRNTAHDICRISLFVMLSLPGLNAASENRNLLPNPSFEAGTPNVVEHWESRSWSGATNAHWTVEAPGRTGKRSVSISSQRGSDAAWTVRVIVKTNSFYRLSGWIKTQDVRGAVGALLNIQNLQEVRTEAVSGTTDWTQVQAGFGTGTAAELEINCLFGGWGQSTGQAWYDDLALEQVADLSQQEPHAIAKIDTAAPQMAYSPMIFGGFIEHFDAQIYGGIFEPGSPLSDGHGFRKDVIEALKELKLAIVRWPGGCFASGYHWTNGIGQFRRPVADPVWGTEDPNTFGTDEFVAWCRLVGCEPYICSNAGDGTPEEMQDWVAYCNSTSGAFAGMRSTAPAQPLNVQYWSIGNENWGGHEIGARTPDEWGPLVLKSAEMMLSVDPNLKLLAAATPDRGWTLPLLNTAGKHLDYVAIHEYWLPCWGENLMPDYLSCIMHSAGPERTIRRVITLLDEAGDRGRVKIAFDEWNLRGWHHPGFPRKQVSDPADPEVQALIRARGKNALASQYTMADALFSASFLNACLRHADDVGMANIAPIVNTRGPLFVHPGGIVKRTTFHVLRMYAHELQSRVAGMSLDCGLLFNGRQSIPVVDGIATCNEERTAWAIALVNRHPSKPARCTIKIDGVSLQGSFTASVLAGDSPDAFNDIAHPERVTPQQVTFESAGGSVNLPPHSLTIVKCVSD